MARVHVHIVGWNHQRFLKRLFESLRTQTFTDTQILYIDNASTDGSLDLVREQFPEVVTLKNTNNLGFTGAHNQGFALALSKWPVHELENRFVLVLNPDMVVSPTFIAELVKVMEQRVDVGAVGGKLLKMFASEGVDRELEQVDQSVILDSTGITRFPSGRLTDRGSGEVDSGQFAEGPVWGISGAAVLFRASALEQVREGDAIFDADFFAYKEDADIAWRLTRAGYVNWYAPQAVAYHFRGAYGKERASLWQQLKNRKNKSAFVSFLSYRNHLLLMVKNLSFRDFVRTSYALVPYEMGKFFAMLFLETRVLFSALGSFLQLFPKMVGKRK